VRREGTESLCLSWHLHLATLVSFRVAIGYAEPHLEVVVVASNFASVRVAQYHLGCCFSDIQTSSARINQIEQDGLLVIRILVVRHRRERRLEDTNHRSKHSAL